MKNSRISCVLVPVVAGWLVFVGCASAPPPAKPVPEPIAVVMELPVAEEPVAEIIEKENQPEQSDRQTLAEEERAEALKAMARADEVQGKNVEKEAYHDASSVFANGERNMGKEDWDAAYFDFHGARESFDLLTERVADKRRQALDALARSKTRTRESEAFALALDKIIEED
jgi:hypothetical protein